MTNDEEPIEEDYGIGTYKGSTMSIDKSEAGRYIHYISGNNHYTTKYDEDKPIQVKCEFDKNSGEDLKKIDLEMTFKFCPYCGTSKPLQTFLPTNRAKKSLIGYQSDKDKRDALSRDMPYRICRGCFTDYQSVHRFIKRWKNSGKIQVK